MDRARLGLAGHFGDSGTGLPPGAASGPRRLAGGPWLPATGRTDYVSGHGRRLARYADTFGRRLGLPDADLATLRLGALLHDIGKHAIPADLLAKQAPLGTTEFEIVKQHTVIGDAICAGIPALAAIRPIVRSHHERLDGSGYPDGLGGRDLPLLVQIVGVVDVYDALVHARPYKPALDAAKACAMLALEAQHGWRSRDLVWGFVDLLRTLGLPPFAPASRPRRPERGASAGVLSVAGATRGLDA